MGDSNDNHDAPAARRNVHYYRPDDDPNFSISNPEPRDPATNDPPAEPAPEDIAEYSTDSTTLDELAGIGALAKARKQIPKLDKDAANLRYELIDQHVSMAMRDGCSRNDAIAYAMERFRIRSSTTVETALAYMRQKRKAELARTPTPFTMTREAEAKAEAFRANESEIKAQAKQRFERKLSERAWWLKGKGRPAMLSWLTNLLQRKRAPLE
jgi:hypothetical protein